MGIESPVHLLFILAVALVVLGPKRLPELARAIGKGVREFRGAMEEGQHEPSEPEVVPPELAVPDASSTSSSVTAPLAAPATSDESLAADAEPNVGVASPTPAGEERGLA